jgi:hypothetical protein
MKGFLNPRGRHRLRGLSAARLTSVDAVLGTVAVSAVVSATASFVVVSNVYDALHGTPSRAAITEAATLVPAAEANTAMRVPARRYPEPDATPVFAGWPPGPDAVPSARSAMRPQAIAFEIGPLPLVTVPPGAEEPAALPRAPIARPDFVFAVPPAASADRDTLVAVSPRPPARPRAAATRLAAVEVARAEAPDSALTPARLSDPPAGSSGRLLPGRTAGTGCGDALARAIPRRDRSAPAGGAVMAALASASGGARDAAIVAEALRGNVPDHLRALQPVRFTGRIGGRPAEIVICVTPDYLAVGSSDDHVRVPLGLPAALQVADAYDMMLPTTRMVDAIYAQADLRLSPRPMTPGPQMSSTDYFHRHDATLDGQLDDAGAAPGMLVAGHKKDVVIANRLARARGRVAIYGWHRSAGDPIQPLSTVHGEYYADYSHGIRLVSRTAFLNGRPVDLRALLTDASYAGLLNSDGVLSSDTVRLASL